jgi:hypothetical protein
LVANGGNESTNSLKIDTREAGLVMRKRLGNPNKTWDFADFFGCSRREPDCTITDTFVDLFQVVEEVN